VKAWRSWAAAAVVAVGGLQILRFLSGAQFLGPIAAATSASPLPLVFDRIAGVETTARRFRVEIETDSGRRILLPGDSTLAARIRGPFARQKVYVETLAYGDLADPVARDRVLWHAFCRGALLGELGVDEPVLRLQVETWSALAPGEPHERSEFACR
jgi:hypothetical protein